MATVQVTINPAGGMSTPHPRSKRRIAGNATARIGDCLRFNATWKELGYRRREVCTVTGVYSCGLVVCMRRYDRWRGKLATVHMAIPNAHLLDLEPQPEVRRRKPRTAHMIAVEAGKHTWRTHEV